MEGEGLEICCLATGVKMATPDVAERDRHIDDLRRYLDLAADLGSPLLRVFGGPRDRALEWPAAVDYVADGFLRVVDQAAAPASRCCSRPTTTGVPRRRCGR